MVGKESEIARGTNVMTEDIHLRYARDDDLEAMTRLYNYYVENTTVTFDTKPFTPEQRKPWLAQFDQLGPHQLFVALCNGELAGYAGTTPHRAKPAYRTSVETTIYVDERFAGHGIGRKLYERLFSELVHQDIHRAYAGVTIPNEPSVNFHWRMGFTEIGTFHEVGRKFDRYQDVMWFEKGI